MLPLASAPLSLRRLLRGAALVLAGLALAAPAPAQGGRLDQLYVRDSKGSVRQVTGTITEAGLDKILVDRDGKETSYENDRVDRILWGQVSPNFKEAQAYFDRGDFENAAAKFEAASSDDERTVIQAVARLSAGEALLHLSATDPTQLTPALAHFDAFLSKYPNNREVPRARMLKARTTLLRGGAGDVKKAGELYRAIFEEGANDPPTVGYDRTECLRAGLEAARALTAAGETLPAREVLGVLSGAARDMLAAAEEGSSARVRLAALSAEAQLGEGYVLLAGGQARQAETFFRAQLQNAKNGPAAQRYGALLGLGEALRAQGAGDTGKLREASLHLAVVAGLDYTDRDRSATALLRLAETLLELGDSDGAAQARTRLQILADQFGDTPAAAPAREHLKTL
ncbi:MAG: hypothetical protein H6828_04045 [Planctomycetes bacterium]|nr:hypothetical protein [Planctomycetota bacterium]